MAGTYPKVLHVLFTAAFCPNIQEAINKPTDIMARIHGVHKLEYYLVLFIRKETLTPTVTGMNSEDMLSETCLVQKA